MPSSRWVSRRLGVLLILAACGCGPTRIEQLLESAHSDAIDQQRTALREIADLGPDAAPAIPDLIGLSEHPHPDIRRLSGLALGNMAVVLPAEQLQPHRKDIVDVLKKQLDDPELAVRNTAAFALLELDPDHAPAQRRLQSAMRKGDGGIIDRLTHTEPAPHWAVPTLVELLNRDRRSSIRRLAAVALGEIDPNNDDAQKALKQATSDSDDHVRSAAQEALGRASR